jgi:hypothetical protein
MKAAEERHYMNGKSKVLLRAGASCLIVMFGEVVAVRGTTVYYNNFDSGAASLNGLTIVDQSPGPPWSSVGFDAGQLRIDPVGPWNTFMVASTASFASPYSPILKNSPGTVTWAFNVSNQDSASYVNNGFFFCLGSDSLAPTGYTSSSYLLFGGAFDGNRMEFNGVGSGFPSVVLFAIPSAEGLGPLPSKGSFRITYEPSTDLWSVFGAVGSDYVDPTTVTNLLGSVVDRTYTDIRLSYMAFGGQYYGSDFFDNVSVSVVPEPSTIGFAFLATAACFVSGLRIGSAQPTGCRQRRDRVSVDNRTSLARCA